MKVQHCLYNKTYRIILPPALTFSSLSSRAVADANVQERESVIVD